jgi:hypothetical protein
MPNAMNIFLQRTVQNSIKLCLEYKFEIDIEIKLEAMSLL